MDLSKSYAIGKIKLWHYFGNERSYKDVIVQISNDPKFSKDVKTVFNNDVDNTAAQGIGTDLEYVETDSGKEISVSNATGRYVRFWSNGSNLNAWNHYSDIQIYKKSDKPILEIPVLMYHGIVETPKNIYQMATVNFEAQMKYLKDNGYTTLTLDEYYKMLQKSMPKPLKPVLITFDDGFANNYTTAAPILKKYNFKATVFTVANFIDTPNYFTTAQVQAMVKDGFDIASHGYNHERFEDYNYEEQLKIILDMKAKLEKITKQKMYYFAYPYGSFNTNIIKILQDQGFKLSFSSVEGFSTKVDHPFVIKRLFISGESTLDDFISILQ